MSTSHDHAGVRLRNVVRLLVVSLALLAFAAPAAAAASPKFGVNDNSYHYGITTAETVLDTLRTLKPGSVYRFTLNWSDVEPNLNDFRWGGLRWLRDRANERGIRLQPLLMSAPVWARGAQGACDLTLVKADACKSPPDRTAFALGRFDNFANKVAIEVPNAYAIEIWNEQNIKWFWTTVAGPNADYYKDVLCAGYSGVRRASSTIPVVMGGLSFTQALSDRLITIPDFLGRMYSNGAMSCTGPINVHPYPWQVLPDDPVNSGFQIILNQARTVRNGRNDSGRPIWATEFGAYTGTAGGAVSEADQARILKCGYQLAAGMSDVPVFFVHTLIDPGTNAASTEDNYGIHRNPNSSLGFQPKPAYDALRDMFTQYGDNVPPVSSCQ